MAADTPNEPERPAASGPGWPTTPQPPAASTPPGDDHDDYDDEGEEEYAEYDLSGRKGRFGGRGRLVAIAVAAVVLVGAGAAFALTSGGDDGGGSDETSGDDGSGSGDDPMADAAFEYAECMRENGVDMPDPVVNDDGGVQIGGGMGEPGEEPSPQDREEMEAAEEECGSILEEAQQGGGPQLTPEEIAERQDQALALAQCMRDRGWTAFPDPQVDENGGIGIAIEADSGLPVPGDPDAEQFEQDQQECNEESGLGDPGGEGPQTDEAGGGSSEG